MDTTYFGRMLGVMVFRGNLNDSTSYFNLYWKYLKHETLKEYHLGLFTLSRRYYFKSFTVDNKGGLIKMLQRKYPDTPIHFTHHFKQLIQKRYCFIQERNHTGNYTHNDIQSAITSIHTNLPYLFTYQRYPHLNIPNTSNSAEGSFGQWKYKVKLHRHQRLDRKKQMIDIILLQNRDKNQPKLP